MLFLYVVQALSTGQDLRDLLQQANLCRNVADDSCGPGSSPTNCTKHFERSVSPLSSGSTTPSLTYGPATSAAFDQRQHEESLSGALSSMVLRQLKDDDSLSGDFDRHQFLDDASRRQWNPQVQPRL